MLQNIKHLIKIVQVLNKIFADIGFSNQSYFFVVSPTPFLPRASYERLIYVNLRRASTQITCLFPSQQSRTSSERLMYFHFTSCVYGGVNINLLNFNLPHINVFHLKGHALHRLQYDNFAAFEFLFACFFLVFFVYHSNDEDFLLLMATKILLFL